MKVFSEKKYIEDGTWYKSFTWWKGKNGIPVDKLEGKGLIMHDDWTVEVLPITAWLMRRGIL